MRNSKVLEMLESNRIDELKAMLQDEIYEEALKSKPGAKKRYAAMKNISIITSNLVSVYRNHVRLHSMIRIIRLSQILGH